MIFSSGWLTVWFLYYLHLSNLLLFSSAQVVTIELPVLLSFFGSLWIPYLLPQHSLRAAPQDAQERGYLHLRKRLEFWFRFWVVMSCFEIMLSGGIPLIWTLTSSSKTYFMFGIPTLHGFLNALILTISIARFTLGLLNGLKRDLLFPLIMIVWSVLVEARQLTVVVLIEVALLFLMYRRIQWKRLVAGTAVVLVAVVLFGVSGDIRSGGDGFRRLAQPTEQYPAWLPSGFLWAYIYVTTPLNNLVNTTITTPPLRDPTMPNTFAQLVPTAVRNLLGLRSVNSSFEGDLVTQSFNVSTAYMGPWQDMGTIGLVFFSVAIALASGISWVSRGIRNNLIYAIIGQCLFLSIFFDHFLYLPIIAQIPWCFVLFRRVGRGLAIPRARSYTAERA